MIYCVYLTPCRMDKLFFAFLIIYTSYDAAVLATSPTTGPNQSPPRVGTMPQKLDQYTTPRLNPSSNFFSGLSSTPNPNCITRLADIAFLIDASGSVDSAEWKQSMSFVNNMLKSYDIGKDKVRVALMTFSNTAQIVFDFNQYQTRDELVAAIAKAPKESMNTNTHIGLDVARAQLFQQQRGMRKDVPHVLIVLTDGQSTNPAQTLQSATAVHQSGIQVAAVGVKGSNLPEITAIASPNLLFKYSNFNDLTFGEDKLALQMCTALKDVYFTKIPNVPISSNAAVLATSPPRGPIQSPTLSGLSSTPNPDCIIRLADIAFLIDASGSVDSSEWKQSMSFVNNMLKSYDIGKDKVRVALMTFSNTAQIVFDFNQYQTRDELAAAIAKAPKESMNTNTHIGLDVARTQLFQQQKGMRKDVPHVLIVLTDGQSTNPAQTLQSAAAVHQSGIQVAAVGVKGSNLPEITAIASPNLLFKYSNFNDLTFGEDKLALQICTALKDVDFTKIPNVPISSRALPTTTVIAPTTVHSAIPVRFCKLGVADIVFLLDASGSVGNYSWMKMLDFVSESIMSYDVEGGQVKIAVIVFSTTATVVFDFNKYKTRSAMVAAVRSSPKQSQGTNAHLGLDLAKTDIFQTRNGMRLGVTQMLIILLDGRSAMEVQTAASAKSLHTLGVVVVAVGIKGFSRPELKAIASDPQLIYEYKDFNELVALKRTFSREMCLVISGPPRFFLVLDRKSTAVPPTVDGECPCVDKDPNCEGFGERICRNTLYRTFAKDLCPVYCNLCSPRCQIITAQPRPCKDTIIDCDRLPHICTDVRYKGYASTACRKYCEFC